MRIYKTAIYYNEKDQKVQTTSLLNFGTFSNPGEGFETIAVTNSIEATLFSNLLCAKISNGLHPSVADVLREWIYFSFLMTSSKFLLNNHPQINDRPDYTIVKEAGMRINAPAYMTDPDIIHKDMIIA